MRYTSIVFFILVSTNSSAVNLESIGRSNTFKAFPHVIGAIACASTALVCLGTTTKIIYLEMKGELEHPENLYNPNLTPIAAIFGVPTVSTLGLLSYLFTCAAADEIKMNLSNAILLNTALSSLITTVWTNYYNFL